MKSHQKSPSESTQHTRADLHRATQSAPNCRMPSQARFARLGLLKKSKKIRKITKKTKNKITIASPPVIPNSAKVTNRRPNRDRDPLGLTPSRGLDFNRGISGLSPARFKPCEAPLLNIDFYFAKLTAQTAGPGLVSDHALFGKPLVLECDSGMQALSTEPSATGSGVFATPEIPAKRNLNQCPKLQKQKKFHGKHLKYGRSGLELKPRKASFGNLGKLISKLSSVKRAGYNRLDTPETGRQAASASRKAPLHSDLEGLDRLFADTRETGRSSLIFNPNVISYEQRNVFDDAMRSDRLGQSQDCGAGNKGAGRSAGRSAAEEIRVPESRWPLPAKLTDSRLRGEKSRRVNSGIGSDSKSGNSGKFDASHSGRR